MKAREFLVATHGHCFDGAASAALFTRLARALAPEGSAPSFRYKSCGYGPGMQMILILVFVYGCYALFRINYAIFGNQDPALHAHVIPRYADEPLPNRTAHAWTYDWAQAPAFDAASLAPLIDAVRAKLG